MIKNQIMFPLELDTAAKWFDEA
jgi:hypothetical protein